jgi:uncharacterized protein DUF4136
MKKINLAGLVLGLAILTGSCRKDVIKNLDGTEGIVYITEHDSAANFSNYQRFRIADSVTVIKDGQLTRREKTSYDSSLTSAIKQVLLQRGFVLESDQSKTPDIGINITRITTDYTGVVSYNDYWGGYGDYWDPYYWGYGGYGYYFPYSFGIYTFREGALSVDMIDLKNPDRTTNKLKTVWTGLARGTGIFSTANINEVVQSLFNQSSYIKK